MARNRERGAMRGSYALDPFLMARVCRRQAAEIRVEAAAGHGRIALRRPLGEPQRYISLDEAAASLDEQAARWELEAQGGPRNMRDRTEIGLD